MVCPKDIKMRLHRYCGDLWSRERDDATARLGVNKARFVLIIRELVWGFGLWDECYWFLLEVIPLGKYGRFSQPYCVVYVGDFLTNKKQKKKQRKENNM